MTEAQNKWALEVFESGWVSFGTWCKRPQSNRAMWKLVQMGIAEMDFGPRGDWLQSYGFMPVWGDPVC